MTKRQAIDRIMQRNPSARPDFLADFTPEELQAYLRQLESLRRYRQPDGSPAAEAAAQRHPLARS